MSAQPGGRDRQPLRPNLAAFAVPVGTNDARALWRQQDRLAAALLLRLQDMPGELGAPVIGSDLLIQLHLLQERRQASAHHADFRGSRCLGPANVVGRLVILGEETNVHRSALAAPAEIAGPNG